MLTSKLHLILFYSIIAFLLLIDLGVFHKKKRVYDFAQSVIWTIIWILLAIAVNVFIYFFKGWESAVEFLTGYVLEKSLSIDNIFIFSLIFSNFKIPLKHQHKVLFWGVISAIVMRFFMLHVGMELINKFTQVMYVFGAILIYSAIKSLAENNHKKSQPSFKFLERYFPVTSTNSGNFFIQEEGSWKATKLFLAMLAIEFADLVFAVDSIPAILTVSRDEFIIISSNLLAILGLRSLYFMLVGIIDKLVYLQSAIAIILGFIGVKLFLYSVLHVPTWFSLMFISSTLCIAVICSIYKKNVPTH